jgi:large subunit ribosomal protein L13
MKTYSPKPDHIERNWYVLDASGQVLGRLATHAATLLRGKHKPMFAPHMDTGDHVIVVNAEKVELTGGKEAKKIAYRHSGYPGGIRATSYDRLLAERPVFAVEKAIRGMLPKNRLGRAMIRKLHVVAGPEHPHAAQKPTALAAGERPAWGGLPVREAATELNGSRARVGGLPRTAPTDETSAGKSGARATTKSPAQETTTKKTTAKTTTAKKTTAKKTTAKRTTAKPTARKATAKATAKASAKSTPAKKTTTRKTTARKTTAKKPPTGRARATKDEDSTKEEAKEKAKEKGQGEGVTG